MRSYEEAVADGLVKLCEVADRIGITRRAAIFSVSRGIITAERVRRAGWGGGRVLWMVTRAEAKYLARRHRDWLRKMGRTKHARDCDHLPRE